MTAPAAFEGESVETLSHGIRENLAQFLHQLLQVLLVGFAIGMMRTVVPALAETEFGVARLRGRSVRERIHALIEIAHPNFRDQLTEQAKDLRLW